MIGDGDDKQWFDRVVEGERREREVYKRKVARVTGAGQERGSRAPSTFHLGPLLTIDHVHRTFHRQPAGLRGRQETTHVRPGSHPKLGVPYWPSQLFQRSSANVSLPDRRISASLQECSQLSPRAGSIGRLPTMSFYMLDSSFVCYSAMCRMSITSPAHYVFHLHTSCLIIPIKL